MRDSSMEPGEEEEESIAKLQAQARALEQREISQMRQGAMLQRKYDAASEQLRERQKSREAVQQKSKLILDERRQESERLQRERRQVQTSERDRRCKKAKDALEMELHGRLEVAGKNVAALERGIRSARTRRREFQTDLAYWRGCAQALLHDDAPSNRSTPPDAAVPATAEGRAAEVTERSEQLVSKTEALKQSRCSLDVRLVEVREMARTARSREVKLHAQNETLATAVSRAEASTTRAREEVAAERRREQEALLEAERADRAEQADRDLHELSPDADASVQTDHLRRKVAEQETRIRAIRTEQARLQAAVQRHAGVETKPNSDVLESVEPNRCRAFDEFVSWVSTLLFRSILVRRFFCIHLVVLYSWLLFLLWYMGSMEHALAPGSSAFLTQHRPGVP